MAGLVLLCIVVRLAGWAIASYNRLVGLRNQVQNGWRQILFASHPAMPARIAALRHLAYQGRTA